MNSNFQKNSLLNVEIKTWINIKTGYDVMNWVCSS